MISKVDYKGDGYTIVELDPPGAGRKGNFLDNLSKVNIFVGENSSGKSRFMRKLFSEDLDYKIPIDIERINSSIRRLKEKLSEYSSNMGGVPELSKTLSGLTEISNPEEIINVITTIHGLEEVIRHFKSKVDMRRRVDGRSLRGEITFPQIGDQISGILEPELGELGTKFMNEAEKRDNFFKIYIPMLRGLRPVNYKGNAEGDDFDSLDIYNKRTCRDYFEKIPVQQRLFTGLGIYEKIKDMLLGLKPERELVHQYEDFLEKHFFWEEVTLTPHREDDVLYIKIGDQEERPIYHMGDGLQTLILCTFPLFMNQDKELILFIEEPELTLHPGMQRKLMEIYCEEFKNAQIFITTHSNHLLDISLDYENKISVYSFKREEEKEDNFIVENITPNKEILDLLGIRNSSVFLSNCIIWVEGISDRIYIKTLLDAYCKIKKLSYEEDSHYSILEYGGGNITHFDFLNEDDSKINTDNINHNNFIIADNDLYNPSTGKFTDGKLYKKGERLKIFNDNLDNFSANHVEIENLIPAHIYKKYFEGLDTSKKLWKYNSSKLTDPGEFDAKLSSEKIGVLLKEYFVELKADNQSKTFKARDASCVGDKKDIAKDISKLISQEVINEESFDKLPKTTQDLIEKLAGFIENANKQF